jgi:hypothetical protein
VQKRRKRTSVFDQPMDRAEPHSTVLTLEQEAMNKACLGHLLR